MMVWAKVKVAAVVVLVVAAAVGVGIAAQSATAPVSSQAAHAADPSSAATQAVPAVPGDRELLKLAAAQYKANFDAIKTWKGRQTTEEDTVLANSHYKARTTVDFAFDSVRKATRWSRKTTTLVNTKDGVEVPDPRLNDEAGVAKGRRIMRFSSKSGPRVLEVLPGATHRLMNSALVFEPLRFMADDTGEPLHDWLMFLYNKAMSPNLSGWTITRAGSLVTVECDKNGVLNRSVLDLDKGSNLVEYNGRGASVTETVRNEFEMLNGIWVIRSRTLDMKWPHPQWPAETQNVKVSWETAALNQPLDDREFSVQSLGVRRGDNVSDRATGKLFEYLNDGQGLSERLDAFEPTDVPAR